MNFFEFLERYWLIITGIAGLVVVMSGMYWRGLGNKENLSNHVESCEKRYKELNNKIDNYVEDTKDNFDRVHSRLDAILERVMRTN